MQKPRRGRWLRVLIAVALLAVVAAELTARFALGLGDPPLMMTDPDIEYLAQPSKAYRRFGNRVAYNAHSMRSDEFPSRKADPAELRILVLGDSVVGGGAWTDQRDIATEVLKRRLQERFPQRTVIVGNISAGSWGPPNLLAYINKYGLFDADAVIIVVGSEDYGDVPKFKPLSWDGPSRRPVLALQEALPRYVPQFISYFRRGGQKSAESVAPRPEDIEASLFAMRQLIDRIDSEAIPLAVALHMDATEIIEGRTKPGYDAFKRMLVNRKTPTIEFGPRLRRAMVQKEQVFRDYAHPNAAGQAIMADALFDWILGALPLSPEEGRGERMDR